MIRPGLRIDVDPDHPPVLDELHAIGLAVDLRTEIIGPAHERHDPPLELRKRHRAPLSRVLERALLLAVRSLDVKALVLVLRARGPSASAGALLRPAATMPARRRVRRWFMTRLSRRRRFLTSAIELAMNAGDTAFRVTERCRRATVSELEGFRRARPLARGPVMAAPILSYEDLGLIQGEGWLFRGLDLYIGERDRLALIGRNGAGKTTLLKCLAGLIDTDEGKRTIVPGTNVVLLEQDPKMDGCATLQEWVVQRQRTLPSLTKRRRSPTSLASTFRARPHGERGRAAPSGDRSRACAEPRCTAARRADQPSRPQRDRVARGMAEALQGRLHRHQPRPHLPDAADAQLHLARSRRAAARRDRLRRLRGVDRTRLRGGGAGSRKARRQAQDRASLVATRGHGAPPSQPGPAGQAQRNARSARGDAGPAGTAKLALAKDDVRSKTVIETERVSKASATGRSFATFRFASSAATGSASSARTALERRLF